MQTMLTKQRGFTIVELIVVMTVLGILITLVLSTLGDFYYSNTTSIGKTVQSTDTTTVLRSIESNITTSAGFVPTTTMTIASPLGFNNDAVAWTYKGSDATKPNNRVLISKQYVTTLPVGNPNRALVYTTASGCSAATKTPAVYNTIYFVKKDTATGLYNLYRRTILPTESLCSTAAQKQSCAIGQGCPTTDAILLFDVDSFTVDYYTTALAQTPIPDQYGSADISTAKSIKITVTTNRRINGVLSPAKSSIRISSLNG
jgi:prepilin-type N-terminal cleavage/methylation domain-containing protein